MCIAGSCCCISACPSGDAVRRRLRCQRRRKARRDRSGHGQPVVTTESVPRVGLLEKGVGWEVVVAAAGASVEPMPTSVGTAKTEAKAVSAAGENRPRPEQRLTLVIEAETRATKLPERAERLSILNHGPFVPKSSNSAEVKRSPPKKALSGPGTSAPMPTPVIGEKGVLSPQALR